MGGCAFLDWVAGVDSEGQASDPGSAPIAQAAPLADKVLPGAGGVLVALAGLWAAIRARAWKRAAISTFDAIEAAAEAGKGVAALKKELAAAHAQAGVLGLVKKVVERYGHKREPKAQILPMPDPKA
jgi:DNA-binding transcriptional LysR family regulator